MEKILPKMIVVAGPTGSGKSDLGIRLAQKFQGEIINADSRQIYKGLVIGTNVVKGVFKKINARTVYVAKDIKHHLIQFVNPEQVFTVAQYKKNAIETINDILSRKKLPILVGGTGLYIRAVTENLIIPPIKPNKILRQKLEKKSIQELVDELARLDEEAAEIIDKNNKMRVIRALEIVMSTGMPLAKTRSIGPKLYDSLKIAIAVDRSVLKTKLLQRAKLMVRGGLIEETINLLRKYPSNSVCFNAIPYKIALDYINGSISQSELVNRIALADYHYSKRQITWLKKEKNVRWVESIDEAEKLVADFLQ